MSERKNSPYELNRLDRKINRTSRKLKKTEEKIPDNYNKNASYVSKQSKEAVLHDVRDMTVNNTQDDEISLAEAIDNDVKTAQTGNMYANKVKSSYAKHNLNKAGNLQKKQSKLELKKQILQAEKDPNIINRYLMKKRIQKQYQNKAKGSLASKAAKLAYRVASSVVKSKMTLIAVVVFFIIGAVMSMVSSMFVMVTGAFANFTSSTFLSDYKDIDESELYYTELETDLKEEIENIPNNYTGYDEYRFEIDSIEHNSLELISFLSAMYDDFKYVDIENVLLGLFNTQYELTMKKKTETKYDANDDPYKWYVLIIRLESIPFIDVITPILEANDKIDAYNNYMETGGNRQIFASPFIESWKDRISSPFGYRQNPTGSGTQFHKGIDIAMPKGTPIYAIHSGKVIVSRYSDSYGYYITIEDNKGYQSKYAHCSELLVNVGQEVMRGDIIALVGSTGDSTGNHLHLEILYEGEHINPLFLLQD